MGYLRLTLDGVTLAEIPVVRETAPAPSGFFVSPSGSDSNPGTLPAPWRTIAKAFATLLPGQTAYLRGGIYTGGATQIGWSRDGTASQRITVQNYPGETPELVGSSVRLDGDYQRLQGILIRDVIPTDTDGINIRGNHAEVIGNTIINVARNGIITGSAQHHALIARNYVRNVGNDTTHSDDRSHAIYLQGDDHTVLRNVLISESGYGISMYQGPERALVACNTMVNCRPSNPNCGASEQGITIQNATGSVVVNNIFDGGRLYPGSYVFDNNSNLRSSWSFSSGGPSSPPSNTLPAPVFTDDLLHLAAGSPGIGQARTDHVYWPDFGGSTVAVGAPAIGAHEH